MDIHRNRNQTSDGEIKLRMEKYKSNFGRMMNKTKKTKD